MGGGKPETLNPKSKAPKEKRKRLWDAQILEEIKKMQIDRIKFGRDDLLKPVTPRRITLAMTRHELFKKMKEDIIKADLR